MVTQTTGITTTLPLVRISHFILLYVGSGIMALVHMVINAGSGMSAGVVQRMVSWVKAISRRLMATLVLGVGQLKVITVLLSYVRF